MTRRGELKAIERAKQKVHGFTPSEVEERRQRGVTLGHK